MRYIHINNPGPMSCLEIAQGPIPSYTETQILVHVRTTALNRADLMQSQGKYPPPKGESQIPGLEVAGDVVAVGSKVTDFKPGDKVYGLVGSGAHAEFCPVEASLAHLIPTHWNYTLGAAIPEALTAVYAAIFDLGHLKPGQTLLIHGAGSGITSLAIQMAKRIKAKVITSVGNRNKVEKAQALGADQVIEYHSSNFVELIAEQSVDLIVDFVGGDYLNKHLSLLKIQGKLIQMASLKGGTAECNLPLLMRNRLHLIGFVLRSQGLDEKSRLWKLAHEHWYDSFSSKEIMPIIDSEYQFEEIEQAQLRMQSGEAFGKIVIHVS